MPNLKHIEDIATEEIKEYSKQAKIEEAVVWEDMMVWAATEDYPRPLSLDTTDYARKPALVEIYHFARSCMP